MNFAPIVIFAFNRPISFQHTVESLCNNIECKDSDLFVFVDGPRDNHPEEIKKVLAVRLIAEHITGFRSINYRFSDQNRGLADSVISGVTEVIHVYGRVIVLEDDLIVSQNFLAFMNQGLSRYEREIKVFSLCGYTNKVKVPQSYPYDSYFCTRSSSWGWGTWADRWDSVDWELKNWNSYRKLGRKFNRWGGSDCWKMLKSVRNGQGHSWAIRFCFSQFLQDKLSLFPIVSKVNNDGFDGEGTNCKTWSRFKSIFDTTAKKLFTHPSSISLNPILYRSAMSYNAILIRIWSRLMYLIH